MTLIIPDNHPAKSELENARIDLISESAASKQDIRALRIGILNIMPFGHEYEVNLLHPLGRSILQIDPIWLRLRSHNYNSTPHSHLDNLYVNFSEAVKDKHLDGLILTGAPVEEIDFEQVTYWKEIVNILDYAKENIPSTLGICWGGLALAKHQGIEKLNYDRKLFGVFPIRRLVEQHPLMGNIDDVFDCPQSRHAGLADADVEKAAQEGRVRTLGWSSKTGYSILETPDHRFVMHLGHPEYQKMRLVEESVRDARKGRPDVGPPENFDIRNPQNTWKSHRNEFLTSWLKYVYLKTDF